MVSEKEVAFWANNANTSPRKLTREDKTCECCRHRFGQGSTFIGYFFLPYDGDDIEGLPLCTDCHSLLPGSELWEDSEYFVGFWDDFVETVTVQKVLRS
jgi:hypothetical protein